MAYTIFNATLDSSSIANYIGRCAPIAQALATFGWIQTSDTNQPMWNGLSITTASVTVSGSVPAQTVTCPYTALVGLPLLPGRTLNITGFTGTFAALNYSSTTANSAIQILTVTPATSLTGTFTFLYTGATSLTGTPTGTAVVTQQATVPGSNTAFQEFWGMGDNVSTGSPFYFNMSYFESVSNTEATYIIRASTSTNGLGAPTGNITSILPNSTSGIGNAGLFEFDVAGGINWFAMITARNNGINNGLGQILAIDRQRTATGAAGTAYVTLIATGGTNQNNCYQQSCFQVGSGTTTTLETGTSGRFGTVLPITATSGTVNNQTQVSPIYPFVGYIDNPHLMCVVGLTADYTEGAIISVQIYGAPHNYLMTKYINAGGSVGGQGVGFPAIRWE